MRPSLGGLHKNRARLAAIESTHQKEKASLPFQQSCVGRIQLLECSAVISGGDKKTFFTRQQRKEDRERESVGHR